MSTTLRRGAAQKLKALPPDICTEADAIARAQQGLPEAFDVLYRLHRSRVFGLCLRMTHNVADAEDLTHDVFLRVGLKIGTFRGDSAFSTWLYRLSVNTVLMHQRKPRRELPLDEMTNSNDDNPLKRELGGPDAVLNGSLERISLERALDCLSPGHRRTMVLHFIEGYRHREIAKITGCTLGTSKSQVHKALLKLQGLLQAPQSRAA